MARAKKIPGVNANIISRSAHTSVAVRDSPDSSGAGVVLAIGGREYPQHHSPRCSVCTSPYRSRLESGLTKGWSIPAVLGRVFEGVPEEEQVTDQALRNHARNHMTHEVAMTRVINEAWRDRLGMSTEDEEGIVTHVGLAHSIMQRTFEGIASGQLVPEIKDGLAAAKVMMDFEARGQQGEDSTAYFEALTAYFQVARETLPPEQLAAFGDALSRHPALQGMMAATEQRQLVPVLDAEAWEDDDDD